MKQISNEAFVALAFRRRAKPLPRCEETTKDCAHHVWNEMGRPLSKYCWEHAKEHGEVTNG